MTLAAISNCRADEKTTQADPHLDSVDANLVKPDGDLLSAQLYIRGHETDNLDHDGKGLHKTESQL